MTEKIRDAIDIAMRNGKISLNMDHYRVELPGGIIVNFIEVRGRVADVLLYKGRRLKANPRSLMEAIGMAEKICKAAKK